MTSWLKKFPKIILNAWKSTDVNRYKLGNANLVIFETRVYGFDGIQTRVWHMMGHLSAADWQIMYYKQLRGGHMEVWLDTQTIRDEAYYRNVSWNNTTWALRVRATSFQFSVHKRLLLSNVNATLAKLLVLAIIAAQ